MKTLILYATKHGATRKIAKLIAQEIPDSVVKDVEESDPHLPSYDCVILGSSLMAGQILGGIYDPQQCNALEKVVMRIVTKSNSYISTVKSDKIAAFVHELNQ